MSARVYYHHKADAIKKDVIALLKKAGVPYWDVNGTMDLVVGILPFWQHVQPGVSVLRDKFIEVWELKSDTKSPLKPSQVEFLKQWAGFPVYVIRSLDEAKRRIGL